MLPAYDEIFLSPSAYRHGFDDDDVAEVLSGPRMIVRNRRGRSYGYEILGRNAAGAYLLLAARVLESQGRSVLRVYHADRMTADEIRRYRKWARR